MGSIAQIIALITGAAENVVPIFIHNPTSQKIEGVIIGDVNAVLSALKELATHAARS